MNKLSFSLHKREAVSSHGLVVSNHPLASLAGVEMLIKGGNAMDASIATLCALTVVEPMMVSVFGAGFSDNLREGLHKMGHEILIVPRIAGGMNGIMVDQKTEMLHGAACWRADGVPIGLSGSPAHPYAMKKAN